MTFTHPSFLWTLLGLTIPIAIHLLSRKEGRVIRVGSLRHVEESNTSQFKSIRLNELLLLFLRCLMITLLALMVSGAQIPSSTFESHPRWVVVERALGDDPRVKSQIDSLIDAGFERHQLAKGFPFLEGNTTSSVGDYWSLAEELNNKSTYDIVVFASGKLSGFKGKREILAPHITWINVDPEKKEFTAYKRKISADSLFVRTGKTSSEGTSFETKLLPASQQSDSGKTEGIVPLRVVVSGGQEFAEDRAILTASLRTLQKEFRLPLTVQQKESDDTDWLFQIGGEAVTKINARHIVTFQDQSIPELFVQTGSNSFHLTHRLTPDVALKQNLSSTLYRLLYPSRERWNAALETDLRVMPEKMAWSDKKIKRAAIAFEDEPMDILLQLLGLFLAVWVIERIISFRKNQ